ncbi:hypothetical protein GCM10027406_30930 [Leifsonia lichenia]
MQNDVDIVRPAPQAVSDERAHAVDGAEKFSETIVHNCDLISFSHEITTFLAWMWLMRRTGFEP